MINATTWNLYSRVIRESLENKQAIIYDKSILIEHFNSLPASSQRIAIAAYRYFKNELHLSEDDIIKLKKYLKVHTNKKQFQYMEQAHIDALKIYLASIANIKQRLILTILFDLGVRRCEVQKVVQSYLKNKKDIFTILCKNSMHKIFLTKSVISVINEALSKYDEQTIINWCNSNNVYKITKKCFQHIGFNGACHDFRRHFAQNLDEKGQRLSVIKTLMGHSNITTTSIYIKQNDNELKQVIENQHKQLHPLCTKDYLSLLTKLDYQTTKIQQLDEFTNVLLQEVYTLNKKYIVLTKNYQLLCKYIKNQSNKKYKPIRSEKIKELLNQEICQHVSKCLKSLSKRK